MSLLIWLAEYLLVLLFCLWLIRWGGAEWLEGSVLSAIVIFHWAPRWSADGIKLFAWMTLFIDTIWFLIGIFNSDVRYPMFPML